MKQNITIEQLNELDDKQKKVLRDWWLKREPQSGDIYDSDGYERVYDLNKPIRTIFSFDCLLPSIGQMVEFLGIQGVTVKNMLNHETGSDIDWQVYFGIDYHTDMKIAHELVDALWEACKEILKSKD